MKTMNAKIKDVKVVMSRFGVTTSHTPQRVVSYVPMVTVTFDDPNMQKTDCMVGDLWGRFKKSDYLDRVLCQDFFVLVFKQEWEIVSADGKLLHSMQPTGEIFQLTPEIRTDYFIVREGHTWVGYDKAGKVVASREMDAEEAAEYDNQ